MKQRRAGQPWLGFAAVSWSFGALFFLPLECYSALLFRVVVLGSSVLWSVLLQALFCLAAVPGRNVFISSPMALSSFSELLYKAQPTIGYSFLLSDLY